ncbi:hypothetical protein BC833DRAFT_583700 [Globomyces pollinis-pini]|nr:hypothetical protein BC833DRAFT_583700 [Globomyces pollinis-pini]
MTEPWEGVAETTSGITPIQEDDDDLKMIIAQNRRGSDADRIAREAKLNRTAAVISTSAVKESYHGHGKQSVLVESMKSVVFGNSGGDDKDSHSKIDDKIDRANKILNSQARSENNSKPAELGHRATIRSKVLGTEVDEKESIVEEKLDRADRILSTHSRPENNAKPSDLTSRTTIRTKILATEKSITNQTHAEIAEMENKFSRADKVLANASNVSANNQKHHHRPSVLSDLMFSKDTVTLEADSRWEKANHIIHAKGGDHHIVKSDHIRGGGRGANVLKSTLG